jgi:hypothetical protein
MDQQLDGQVERQASTADGAARPPLSPALSLWGTVGKDVSAAGRGRWFEAVASPLI